MQVFFGKTMIGLDQAPGEIGRSIAHQTFHLIQNRPYLLSGESRVVEERNKGMNGLLEVDIVLPKGIICINQEMVTHFFSSLSTERLCFRTILSRFPLMVSNRLLWWMLGSPDRAER